MNQLVFLYELDSVRNSREEIIFGQKALYDELMRRGNIVVLALNQLTDSLAFTSAIFGPEGTEKERRRSQQNFEGIIELFKAGRIKFNRFYDKNNGGIEMRTPLQYFASRLKAKKGGSETEFIFSGVPCDYSPELLECTRRAVANVDVTELLQKSFDAMEAGDGETALAYRRMARFVNLLAQISLDNDAFMDALPKEATIPITEYVQMAAKALGGWPGAMDAGSAGQVLRELPATLARLASQVLHELPALIPDDKQSKQSQDPRDFRSNWYKALNQKSVDIEREVYELAKTAIDLSYNYSCEISVAGAALRYTATTQRDNDGKWHTDVDRASWEADFFTRLDRLWSNRAAWAHDFDDRKDDLRQRLESAAGDQQFPNWARRQYTLTGESIDESASIASLGAGYKHPRAVGRGERPKGDPASRPHYELSLGTLRAWRRALLGCTGRRFVSGALPFIAVFLVMELACDFILDWRLDGANLASFGEPVKWPLGTLILPDVSEFGDKMCLRVHWYVFLGLASFAVFCLPRLKTLSFGLVLRDLWELVKALLGCLASLVSLVPVSPLKSWMFAQMAGGSSYIGKNG